MTDSMLEKVIKGLECCRRGFCFACPYNDGIDENTDCKQKWADDALVLLKAQQPRVMTYDELTTLDGAFLIESSPISQLDWVFFFDTDTKSDAIWVESFDGERYVVYREDYGTYMRCWTARPTDEQRKAVKWDG